MIYRIYFDMDGVLCDFNGHYKSLFGKFPHEEVKPVMWKNIYRHGSFFKDLPWLEEGKRLFWQLFDHHFNASQMGVLSAYGGKVDCYEQKLEWADRELFILDAEEIILVPDKKHKARYAKPYYVLIDDRKENVDQWREAGGIGIHFGVDDAYEILGLRR